MANITHRGALYILSATVAVATVGNWLHATSLAAPRLPLTPKMEQDAAVATIERLGGKVIYDYQRYVKRYPDGDRSLIDPDAKPDPAAFYRVVNVSLRDSKATDDDLRVLAKLPALEALDLTNSHAVTGAALAHIRGLKNLRFLGLWNTQVDDAGLEHIAGLIKLQTLVLDGTRVTDAGLIHLSKLDDLQTWLGLANTKISDEGLKHLEGLTKLHSLILRKTSVTEDGVKKLKEKLKKADISFRN